MKTKVTSLLVVILIATTQFMAQERITVEAQNNDISNNLDLKAVATAFGESKNMEEFEQKLNDYDSGISNLDLNNDGQVDYLRVIEKMENDVHVVVIQAVLDKNAYQDVASIVVEKDQNNNPTVQIVGDPYLYGANYVIEPTYSYTPFIFSFFWGSNYYSWNSPYYWGYYPSYYRYHSPIGINMYLSNIRNHINYNHNYYYTQNHFDNYAQRIHQSISRNDYGNRYPERNFSTRNENIRNKRDFEFNRNRVIQNNQTRQSYQGNSTGTRPTRTWDNSNVQRNSQSNGLNQRNSNQRTYTTPSDSRNSNSTRNGNTFQNRTNNNESGNRSWQNSGGYRNQSNTNNQKYTPPTNNRSSDVNNNIQRNNTYQPRPNTDNGNRNYNSVNRGNTNTRTAPIVNQPTRTVESKPAVQRQSENTRSNEQRSGTKTESRSSNNESKRR